MDDTTLSTQQLQQSMKSVQDEMNQLRARNMTLEIKQMIDELKRKQAELETEIKLAKQAQEIQAKQSNQKVQNISPNIGTNYGNVQINVIEDPDRDIEAGMISSAQKSSSEPLGRAVENIGDIGVKNNKPRRIIDQKALPESKKKGLKKLLNWNN